MQGGGDWIIARHLSPPVALVIRQKLSKGRHKAGARGLYRISPGIASANDTVADRAGGPL